MNAARNRDWDGFEDVTPRRDDPDIERAREVAYAAAMNHHIHELAIDSPFQVESMFQQFGQQILEALGYPSKVTLWAPTDETLENWGAK